MNNKKDLKSEVGKPSSIYKGKNIFIAIFITIGLLLMAPSFVVAAIGDMTTYGGTANGPLGIAFDGTNMWVSNYESFSSAWVTKVSPTGVMNVYVGTGQNPYGIAFDGTNMWTANFIDNSVTKISPTGVMTTYTGTGYGPYEIAFDGTNMWTTNYGAASVTKIVAVLSVVGTIDVSSNISSSWTITGPSTIIGSGTSQSSPSQPVGTYTITWGVVSGYTTPASQSLTLTSGGTVTFNGTYSPVASCALPWGGSIASGNSVTAYQSASVISPLICVPESRTCTNGVLSGTYINQSCSVASPAPNFTFTATTPVSSGGTSDIKWYSVTNATRCTPSGGSTGWSGVSTLTTGGLWTTGPLSPGGSSYTYILTCTGPGGSPSKNTMVNVTSASSATGCNDNTFCESNRGETVLNCPKDCKVKYRQF